jgi:ABC-2 type transport system permease protein
MSSLSLPRPGTARGAAFGQIVLNEARLTLRRPIGLIGGVGIPVVLLVIFGELPSFHQPVPGYGGLILFNAYVPVLIVFALALLALLGLPIPLVSQRELGVLRRLSTTPVPPSWLLAAQAVVQLCVAVTALGVIVVASVTAFGASAPKSIGGLGLSLVLSIAGLFPIGLVIAAMARTANAASVIGRLAFFPMMFFAGLWLPRAHAGRAPGHQRLHPPRRGGGGDPGLDADGLPPGRAAARPGGLRGGLRSPGAALLPLGVTHVHHHHPPARRHQRQGQHGPEQGSRASPVPSGESDGQTIPAVSVPSGPPRCRDSW